MSLAVLTDSTTAQASPALNWRPTAGSSTKTMSVSSCWAWSVMPTVAVSPATRSHSWDLAYFKSAGTFELIIDVTGPRLDNKGREPQRKNWGLLRTACGKWDGQPPARENVCREFQFRWACRLWPGRPAR